MTGHKRRERCSLLTSPTFFLCLHTLILGGFLICSIGMIYSLGTSILPQIWAQAEPTRAPTHDTNMRDGRVPLCPAMRCSGQGSATTNCQENADLVVPTIDTIDADRQEVILMQSARCPQYYYTVMTIAQIRDVWQRAETLAPGMQVTLLHVCIMPLASLVVPDMEDRACTLIGPNDQMRPAISLLPFFDAQLTANPITIQVYADLRAPKGAHALSVLIDWISTIGATSTTEHMTLHGPR